MVDLRCDSEIEVLSGADAARRRPWNDADKLQIVEESFAGHRQVSATARRHGISHSLLTVWRRQYRKGELGGDPQAWLADVIARISDLPVSRLPALPPWHWQRLADQPEKAA